ncbi:tyrosine-type recombinase/integrase [Prevotellaceae bacterium LKV-178-WT-2A]|uniref:Tyrosine-type recombinase/integrase n=2 Tax=Hallella mizrahii TaxID=2606637 RepID=A0A7K0KH12_9BACT|nr:tyrosine-type recombinase/integrase [Hallella mizrahii]
MVKMVISYYSQIAEVPICSQYHFTVSLSPSSNDLIGQYLGVRFHMEDVHRGFLTGEELNRIITKKIDSKSLQLVRDLFVFSCFTGISYGDVRALEPSNVVTMSNMEWITGIRLKTKQRYSVVLFDGAKLIMKKYENAPRCKGHIFPVISNQKTNKFLKKIASICGIEKNLTFHMARHTFATLALTKGVSIEVLSKMLGHANIKSTQVYADITNKKVASEMKKLFKDADVVNVKHETEDMTGISEDAIEKPKPAQI